MINPRRLCGLCASASLEFSLPSPFHSGGNIEGDFSLVCCLCPGSGPRPRVLRNHKKRDDRIGRFLHAKMC